MTVQISDTDISKKISVDVGVDYKTALDFINTNPEYSLLKFREIINTIVSMVGQKHDLVFESESLFSRINCLMENQLISHPLMEQLHIARKLGNEGVHADQNLEGAAEFRKTRKELLIKNAHRARELVVSIFEDAYVLIVNSPMPGSVYFVAVGHQAYREILYDASVNDSASFKLKAGILCETIYIEQRFELGLALTNKAAAHLENLEKNAISFYNASCEISADVDGRYFSGEIDFDKELHIRTSANPEALFRYGALSIKHSIETEQYKIGVDRIKAAAERGYGPAQSCYGAELYDQNEFEEAEKYLGSAALADDVLALRFLCIAHIEGHAANANKELGVEYLKRAVELECPDATAMLGEFYHKGEHFEKDDERAKLLLEKSIEMGSEFGKKYFLVEFNDMAGQIRNQLQKFVQHAQEIRDSNVSKPYLSEGKVGRNERCPCGSGKKYKKCCGSKVVN